MIAYLFQPSRDGEKSRLWSARIRLDEWPKARRFPLHVTDKRVADHKLRDLVTDLEREAHGVGIPKPTREAGRVLLTEHHKAFLVACEAARLSANTLGKYRLSLPKLFGRCQWTTIRDITAQSFTAWRDESGLSPKSVNDFLGTMRTFLLWMKRKRFILVDPLETVRKVSNPNIGGFRRSLSVDEAQRLLAKAPPRRALVYLALMYTGLRRNELNGLKWGDFDFGVTPARLRLPSLLSKNRRESIHFLRPELTAAILAVRPADVKPDAWAFRGMVPRIPTFKRDLAAAEIPFEDVRGRRVDLHALRKTYGTMLAASGVSPRVAMELMRHSDMKLTMGVYTDVAQLPIIQESARLPSLQIPARSTQNVRVSLVAGAQGSAQRDAQTGVFSGRELSPPDAMRQELEICNPRESVALGRKKAPSVTTGRFHQMERAKRLELSTSTLARWCSTN